MYYTHEWMHDVCIWNEMHCGYTGESVPPELAAAVRQHWQCSQASLVLLNLLTDRLYRLPNGLERR